MIKTNHHRQRLEPTAVSRETHSLYAGSVLQQQRLARGRRESHPDDYLRRATDEDRRNAVARRAIEDRRWQREASTDLADLI